MESNELPEWVCKSGRFPVTHIFSRSSLVHKQRVIDEYYYRTYPYSKTLASSIKIDDIKEGQEMAYEDYNKQLSLTKLLDDAVERKNPPVESQKKIKSFYGIFIAKGERAKKFYVGLLVHAELTFLDVVKDELEQRECYSKAIVEVSREMYDYPFKPGGKYRIDFNTVTPL